MMHTPKNSSANEGHCDMGQDAAKDPPNPPLPRGGELQFPPLPRGGEDVDVRMNLVSRTVRVSSIILCLSFAHSALFSIAAESVQNQKLDPAAWGKDHVGKPVPEYLTGDECLFCHRGNVGPGWASNRHNVTMHALEANSPAFTAIKKELGDARAAEVKTEMGGRILSRFLKPSAMYGKWELLSTEWAPASKGKPGALLNTKNPHWDAAIFADKCAGCHATGVDPKTRAISSPSLDCFTCHGEVDPKHSKDTALVHLSRKRNDPSRLAVSLCAQCHARGGHSRSSGLTYPNNFVAGDNLFRDFQVDLSSQAIEKLDPADRHIMENIRDVVILGQNDVTCLTCHQVHKQSTLPHRRLVKTAICLDCHNATGSMKIRKAYEVHSKTCGY